MGSLASIHCVFIQPVSLFMAEFHLHTHQLHMAISLHVAKVKVHTTSVGYAL